MQKDHMVQNDAWWYHRTWLEKAIQIPRLVKNSMKDPLHCLQGYTVPSNTAKYSLAVKRFEEQAV